MFNNYSPFFTPQQINPMDIGNLIGMLSGLTNSNNGLSPFDPIGAIIRYGNTQGNASNPFGLSPMGQPIIRYNNPQMSGGYVNPYGGNNPFYNPNGGLSPVDYSNPFEPINRNNKDMLFQMLGIPGPYDLPRFARMTSKTGMQQSPMQNPRTNVYEPMAPQIKQPRNNMYQNTGTPKLY